MALLCEADERMDPHYELKHRGYSLEKLSQRVAELYQIDREDLSSKGRHTIRAEARSVFCYWAVREVGGGRNSGCQAMTDEPIGCGLCGTEGREDCESEGYADDRIIIELQMDVPYLWVPIERASST